jgi:hypothetical protein
MSLTSKFNPELCQKILTLFKNGDSPFKICKEYGISEHNFRSIILKYPELFSHAKKIRLMNQNKKRKKIKDLHTGPTVTHSPEIVKITDEDRIKILERKLELSRKENEQLKNLLGVAKEYLGKS